MSGTVFTDDQVTSACNLHIDNLRRLITWGAVKPAQAGGGRGRVRLWSFAQAMRVAATAEFVEAGFSLRMAHTLTYCLPLDYMLRMYEPNFIDEHVIFRSPTRDKPIGNVIIIERRLVYADLLGDPPALFGIIDIDSNLFYPSWDPNKYYEGTLYDIIDAPLNPAIVNISQKSLLVDGRFYRDDKDTLQEVRSKLTERIERQIDDLDNLRCRNYLKINLHLGLVIAFRKLLDLPVTYKISEAPLYDR